MGAPPTAGLSVNFSAIGSNLANAGTLATVLGSGPDISITAASADAHVVVDVLGYFYSAP